MSQQELLRLLQQKDPVAFAKLETQFGPLLRYCIRAILPDPREQEECLADLFVQVWNRIDSYDPAKGKFPAWIATLARNAALNRARTLQRKQGNLDELSDTLPDPSPTPEELLLRKERAKRIKAVVDALPRNERLLFYRKYYYLQSTAQIAAELGLSIRAVEGRLYRLRQKLRNKLGDEFYGE